MANMASPMPSKQGDAAVLLAPQEAAAGATSGPVVSLTVTSFSLRIKNLPSALSKDAVTLLLSHYGATSVRILRRKKPGAVLSGATAPTKASQVAIAVFPTKAQLLAAQTRLTRVQFAGAKLCVEVIDAVVPKRNGHGQGSGDADLQQQPPRVVGAAVATPASVPAPSRAPPPVPVTAPRIPAALPFAPRHPQTQRTPVPLAPHLGLHYAPSPLLHYKYPKASVPIVRNIANALIALPRFYTQVLHLMNKMNLPTPFENDAIQGVFSEAYMASGQKRHHHQQQQPSQLLQIVEDEEEDEESESEGKNTSQKNRQSAKPEVSPRDGGGGTKRSRSDSSSGSGSSSTAMMLPASKTASKKRPRTGSLVGGVAAVFDVDHSTSARSFLHLRPGVISSDELDRQRVSAEELARQHPLVFGSYAVGKPSRHVFVGNLAESVDAKDLEYVFGYVLPLDQPISSLQIDMAVPVGTARRTAVVHLPSLDAAAQAVELIHGVVLDGRALLVRHHAEQTTTEASAPAQATEPATAATTTSSLERMDPAPLALEKAMKNYQRGEPTNALYLKNLANSVDEPVLRALCCEFLPSEVAVDTVSIRHFSQGRMKNQAFLEFQNVHTATRLLDQLHGRLVHTKPLVVSFRKATTSPMPS